MSYLCATGFDKVCRSPGEENPLSASVDESKYDWVVGKRPKLVEKMSILLKDHANIHILYMLRDPRAVLVSKHPRFKRRYYTAPERWIKSVQMLDNSYLQNNKRFLIIRYEHLIKHPSDIQNMIGERFGLISKCNFEECYKQFESIDRSSIATMHGARAMDTSRITSWQNSHKDIAYINKTLKKFPIIVKLMEQYGY